MNLIEAFAAGMLFGILAAVAAVAAAAAPPPPRPRPLPVKVTNRLDPYFRSHN